MRFFSSIASFSGESVKIEVLPLCLLFFRFPFVCVTLGNGFISLGERKICVIIFDDCEVYLIVKDQQLWTHLDCHCLDL